MSENIHACPPPFVAFGCRGDSKLSRLETSLREAVARAEKAEAALAAVERAKETGEAIHRKNRMIVRLIAANRKRLTGRQADALRSQCAAKVKAAQERANKAEALMAKSPNQLIKAVWELRRDARQRLHPQRVDQMKRAHEVQRLDRALQLVKELGAENKQLRSSARGVAAGTRK